LNPDKRDKWLVGRRLLRSYRTKRTTEKERQSLLVKKLIYDHQNKWRNM